MKFALQLYRIGESAYATPLKPIIFEADDLEQAKQATRDMRQQFPALLIALEHKGRIVPVDR